MTSEEAIVQIENAIIAGSLDDVSCGALKLAIEALKMRNPEKTKTTENNWGWLCPHCNMVIGKPIRKEHYFVSYCGHCGKALDWNAHE